MKLYLLRHAIAVDREAWHRAEAERPLTPDGIWKMKEIACGMDSLGLKLDRILTSPFRRAFDTAVIAAKALGLKKELRISRLLEPEGDPKALVRRLALDFRSWESVMLVGHEPYLGRLMSVLLTGTPEASLELKKGGLARLSSDSLTYGQCAKLDWVLTPKVLRKFA